MPRVPRWVWITFVAFGVAFVIACGIAASRLTLFWDDYEFILMQIRQPFTSTFMGSNSHNGPISMAALKLATSLFGLWFPGYAMTNAALAVSATGMLMAAVWGRMRLRPWVMLVCAAVYLTALGLVAQVLIAICLEWFIAAAFAAGAALAVSRGRHWGLWGGLLVASGLSMSGTIPVNALIVAVVYLLCRWPDQPDSTTPADATASVRRPLVVAACLVALGAVGGVLGAVLTRLYPMDYYRSITESTGAVPVPTSVLDALSTTVSLFTSWIMSPLFVVALTSLTFILTLTIFVADHLVLWAIGATVVVIVLVVMLRQLARQTTMRRAIGELLPLLMLLPALGWAVLLAIARGGAPFNVRYQMIWLLPVMVTYAMVVAAPSRSRLFRIGQLAVGILLAGSAVVGIARLPASFETGANEDKPRWDLSVEQRSRMLECTDDGSSFPTPIDDISPGLSGEDFCTVVNHLRTQSVAGRLFGVAN